MYNIIKEEGQGNGTYIGSLDKKSNFIMSGLHPRLIKYLKCSESFL